MYPARAIYLCNVIILSINALCSRDFLSQFVNTPHIVTRLYREIYSVDRKCTKSIETIFRVIPEAECLSLTLLNAINRRRMFSLIVRNLTLQSVLYQQIITLN